jgi:hypothetical protein
VSTLHDHGFVHRQVAALHDHLAQFEGGTSVDGGERTFGVGEIARIRHALRRGMDNESQHPGGHYYARDPLISLMQSAAHEQLVTRGTAGTRVHRRRGPTCSHRGRCPCSKPKPSPTAASIDALNAVRWEYRDFRTGADDNERWAKHGFAVVDVEETTLTVSHVDDDGNVYMKETI